jgi:predicted porin
MKTKNALFALAALGLYAGAASAQSSVTLFGLIDLSANDLKTGGIHKYTMSTDQLSNSRLGFRGVEDLGDGLKASFWLEGSIDPSSGTTGGGNGIEGSQGTAGGNAFFNRRSTVSLSNRFGEVRFGRDFNPTLWNTVFFDVYGADGIGNSLNMVSTLGSGAQTLVWANNSIGYFLPDNLGGFYGQAMVAAGEGVPGQKYEGGRFGYTTGGFDTAIAYSTTKTATSDDYKVFNVGASYDFGVAKIFGLFNESKYQGLKLATSELSISVPLGGQGQVNAAYLHADASGTDATGINTDGNDGDLYSVQYVYNLSKRTSLYTGAAHLKNKGNAEFSVNGADAPPQPIGGGASSTGFNVGIRHAF